MNPRLSQVLDDLQTAPASQRALFDYIEHARIGMDRHSVVCWKAASGELGEQQLATTIPYANIAFLLLGPGTSITSAAMEALAAANVVVGFTGGSKTPLSAGVEPICFASGQSEYRPTAYMQSWASWWFDEPARIEKARQLLNWRLTLMDEVWRSNALRSIFRDANIVVSPNPDRFFGGGSGLSRKKVSRPAFTGSTVTELLGQEGQHVQKLYDFFRKTFHVDFLRNPEDRSGINGFLTQGNYVAYGLAATALHGLGISFAFPVLHGKTRRGALVFDIADPIKDAAVVPLGFLAHAAGWSESQYRNTLKDLLEDEELLKKTMQFIKSIAPKS